LRNCSAFPSRCCTTGNRGRRGCCSAWRRGIPSGFGRSNGVKQICSFSELTLLLNGSVIIVQFYVETFERVGKAKANCCFSMWNHCRMPCLLFFWRSFLLHKIRFRGHSYQ
jgi:hypothetical protein